LLRFLGLWENIDEKAVNRFGKEYDDLSTGQKYELLNNILLNLKKSFGEDLVKISVCVASTSRGFMSCSHLSR